MDIEDYQDYSRGKHIPIPHFLRWAFKKYSFFLRLYIGHTEKVKP